MSEKTEKPEEAKPEEAKPEEAKPKEVKSEEAVKRKEIGAWQHYEYDYNAGKITLKNRQCPRCKAVMAHHVKPVARWTCGTCAYTEYVKTEMKK